MRKLLQMVVMGVVLAGLGAGFSNLAVAECRCYQSKYGKPKKRCICSMDKGTKMNKDAIKQLKLYQPGNGGRDSASPIQIPGPQ